ncbi:hypothetical protein GCM10010201_21260 [Pilimelia columellifera subsp. columellifera]|uniref:ADP-ribosylglycohydrolase n=1 Tax=Pilimelia columellifera subsp. columellifera TaxID=706583 RepID=A0ABP6AT19_9ACTN
MTVPYPPEPTQFGPALAAHMGGRDHSQVGSMAGMTSDSLLQAMASLRGLAVGDALGSQFFVPDNRPHFDERTLPPGRWQWTDDTEMACSVIHVLNTHGRIDQDVLAASFAARHDFDRGYGPAANRLLRLVREGGDWRQLAGALFEGQGSYGNGAAMRVAPLGAWYAGDLDAAAEQAGLSSLVTHTHPEAVAGAVAVAVAAALVAGGDDPADPVEFLAAVADRTPAGSVHAGIRTAAAIPNETDPRQAGRVLGNGSAVSAVDTVPFTLWVAAHHRDDFTRAFWATAAAGGDIDTTCAIVGGILAARGGPHRPPKAWWEQTESLPRWAGRRAWPITMPRPIPAPQRVYSDEQWQQMQSGYTARGMDEKWDLHVRDGWLYAHRSWTGNGMYAARFVRDERGWSIAELHVERNQDLYRADDDAHDTRLLETIVDAHLLGLGWNSTPR